MINGLNPYSAYKDSGVPWLGEVPEHWEVRRNGNLFSQRNETGFPDLPILEVSLKTGVRVRDFSSEGRKQMMSEKEKYKRAARGDIAYNMMRMWQGAVGVAPVDGLISPAYVVARPQTQTNARYYANLFRIDAYMAQVNHFSRGIVSDRNRLYWEDFKDMPSPFPPPNEQAAVVHVLDHVDRRIRRCIRAKQTLIKLLEEQKQAIIHHTFTCGLNANARFKPSGVEWLGYVPEHWEVRRLKFLAHMGTGGRDTVDRKDDGQYPFFVRSQKVERIDTFSFNGEAVLTAGDGAGVAKVFHYVVGKFDYHQRVYKFSNFRNVLGKFFFYYFRSTLRYEAFRETAKSTVDSLRLPMLSNFPVPLPPLGEQQQIVETVERETAVLEHTLETIQREIVLLREFRIRLIADVVTGKFDVRELAGRLPDEAEEPEPRDNADVLADAEEDAGGNIEVTPEEAEV